MPTTGTRFTSSGTFPVRLLVTTDAGLTADVVHDVVVTAPGGGALACFGWTPPDPVVNQAIVLDATCSDGAGEAILFYRWWFDWSGDPADPPSSELGGPFAEAVYTSPGDHLTRLEVETTTGVTGSTVRTIPVTP